MIPRFLRKRAAERDRSTGPAERSMKDIMDRAEWLLEEEESFIVSVQRLLDMLEKRFGPVRLEYEDFVLRLESDSRFRVMREHYRGDAPDPEAIPVDRSIAAFTEGTRVMLKERIPTRKEVVAFLLKKADTTFDTLKKAWDVRPPDDEVMEDQLLQALAKTQRLQRELRDILAKENS